MTESPPRSHGGVGGGVVRYNSLDSIYAVGSPSSSNHPLCEECGTTWRNFKSVCGHASCRWAVTRMPSGEVMLVCSVGQFCWPCVSAIFICAAPLSPSSGGFPSPSFEPSAKRSSFAFRVPVSRNPTFPGPDYGSAVRVILTAGSAVNLSRDHHP
jgi:hypothetical protein